MQKPHFDFLYHVYYDFKKRNNALFTNYIFITIINYLSIMYQSSISSLTIHTERKTVYCIIASHNCILAWIIWWITTISFL